MSDADALRAIFAQQLEVQRQQRAAMEETTSQLRQDLLRDGADPGVLRQYELNVIDLALLDALERTMQERFRSLDQRTGDG